MVPQAHPKVEYGSRTERPENHRLALMMYSLREVHYPIWCCLTSRIGVFLLYDTSHNGGVVIGHELPEAHGYPVETGVGLGGSGVCAT